MRQYSERVRKENKRSEKPRNKSSQNLRNTSKDKDKIIVKIIQPCKYESVSSNIQKTKFMKEINKLSNAEAKLEKELNNITDKVNILY